MPGADLGCSLQALPSPSIPFTNAAFAPVLCHTLTNAPRRCRRLATLSRFDCPCAMATRSGGGWYKARDAVELIRTRSMYVRVNPTPINLSERRAVLHALQKFGTVEVFKRLPVSSEFPRHTFTRNAMSTSSGLICRALHFSAGTQPLHLCFPPRT